MINVYIYVKNGIEKTYISIDGSQSERIFDINVTKDDMCVITFKNKSLIDSYLFNIDDVYDMVNDSEKNKFVVLYKNKYIFFGSRKRKVYYKNNFVRYFEHKNKFDYFEIKTTSLNIIKKIYSDDVI